ncbi:conserved hypothetical protein [Xenorhabdus nematophila F1]|uniref:Uncharacterized protein n=1 Tax=Xenorhabdus nematophila (strain ATCC 19061 / DSM 3370 / CCUG 14189 / LMG 1036 / NCIMB 9965 / AN6) TaxID=406817 RepID=D3VA76_XENNA|nr:hypothetical protein XNC1_3609 [Xenorhabdus nematophila ATCC 19061]CCW32939.1 conserved hypothetical protein [Xenorhabdus nematophila F1]
MTYTFGFCALPIPKALKRECFLKESIGESVIGRQDKYH